MILTELRGELLSSPVEKAEAILYAETLRELLATSLNHNWHGIKAIPN